MGSWGHIGKFWGCMCVVGDHLGQCRGHLGEILEGLEGYLGPRWGLGFEVCGLRFCHHNAYTLEMQKPLSRYACAAKTPA